MKIVVNENQKAKLVSRVENMIDDLGVISTIKNVGGFENFDKILPGYFYPNSKQIEFIEEAIKNDENGRIYLHELRSDILVGKEDGAEGHTLETYIDFVELYNDNGIAHLVTWEYDDEGTMFDEYYSDEDIYLTDLARKYVTEIFEMIFEYYLETQEF